MPAAREAIRPIYPDIEVIGAELTPDDLADLARSWITPQLASEAMLRRVTSIEGAQLIGRSGVGNYSGIAFPYIWPAEAHVREYRVRRDQPDIEYDRDGKPKEKAKYLSPPGRGNLLYLVPGTPAEWLEDVSVPVFLVEGEKKTLALFRLAHLDLSHRCFLPVGIAGVWNWRGNIGKTEGPRGERRNVKGPIPDLSRISWAGRVVNIVFDVNAATNDSVAAARRELVREMMLRGAEVFTVDLPAVDGVNGIDDLLAVWGPDRVLELLSNAAPAKPPDHASTKEIADAICRSNHFAQDAGSKLYRYVDGVYRSDGSQHVKRLVKDLLERWKLSGKWSSHRAEEVVEYIRVDAPLLWEKPPVNVINVLNGLLRVEWGAMRELRPHTPEHFSAVQLPISYDPAAACPNTEKFVKDVFPDDAQEVPWELFALLMTPGPSFQKAVLLIGCGGNGKSTFLAQLIAFIGKKNVSNVSLHKLESDKFAGARLIGKLANICPDLPSEHLSGTSVFKAITGGDPISAEYKFKDGFDFVPFCRLVFSANTPPKSQDSSEGFFDRWLVIPFNRAFRGTGEEIPRSQLDAILADPRELSGVLNKALDAFPTVSVKGITETASMREAWSEFRMVTDHLAVWLERATVEYAHACTRKNALRIAYNAARDGDGLANMTASAFGRALKKLRPNMQEAQRTFAGKVEWVYLGIGLKTPQDLHPVHEVSDEFSNDDSRGSRDSRDLPFFNLSREEDRGP